MSKMREFLFKNDKGDEKKVESISLKKAIKSAQSHFKDKIISLLLYFLNFSPIQQSHKYILLVGLSNL